MSRYRDRVVPFLCLLGLALAACTPQNQAAAPPGGVTVTMDGRKMTPSEALAASRTVTEQQVAAVPVATDRIPGRVLVVLPDRDRLRPLAMAQIGQAASNPAAVEYTIDSRLIGIRGTADGLTKSKLFDSVTVTERNDTEDPAFDGYDYLVWFKIATIGPDHTGQWYGRWQIRRAPDRTMQTASFDAGVPLRERISSFVKSVQTAAVKLGAPGGAGVAASNRESGPGGSLSGIVIDT